MGRLPKDLTVEWLETPTSNQSGLTFEVRPRSDKPWLLDLRPFRDGSSAVELCPLPEMISDLAPTLRALTLDKGERSGDVFLDALRNFWRFLQHLTEALGQGPRRLADIGDDTGQLFKVWLLRERGLQDSTANTYYNRVRRILSDARRRSGVKNWELVWPSLQRRYAPLHRDIDPATFKPLYATLKEVHYAASALQNQGMASASTQLATVRTVLDSYLGEPGRVPDTTLQVALAACESRPAPLPRRSWRDPLWAARTFVPTWRETSAAFYLVLMHTGWNPETVENIDVSTDSDWVDYRLGSQIDDQNSAVAIYGYKNRVGREQIAFSLTRPAAHPYRVIRSMIARTAPLREHLRLRLLEIECKGDLTFQDEQSASALRRMIRSPWLYLKKTPGVGGYVACIEKSSAQNHALRKFASEAIARQRKRGLPEDQIERLLPLLNLRPSDFRDGFASYVFEAGLANIFLVKNALNHRRLSTTQAYVRQRRQLAQRMAEFGSFQRVLFDEMAKGNGVDPTFIFLRVRRSTLTAEQRRRVQDHRRLTRMGTGCLDPTNPPPNISSSPTGGLCAVQRCTLCRHAIVFPESIPLLARRQAELEHVRCYTPFDRFESSSFRLELDALAELRGKLPQPLLAQFKLEAATHSELISSGAAYLFDQVPPERTS